jgi:hypothetical protein
MQNLLRTRYVASATINHLLLMLNQSQALLNAIKEYETNKWKVIGAKVGKPAKVLCLSTLYSTFLNANAR